MNSRRGITANGNGVMADEIFVYRELCSADEPCFYLFIRESTLLAMEIFFTEIF